MPNYVTNKLKIKGATKERLKEFVERYFSTNEWEEVYFDFDKVIPMPEELMNTEESSSTPNEVFENNMKKYGYRSWYDWACDKWGTKWNSCNTINDIGYEFENGEYLDYCMFETAWSPSIPVIEELAKQNPDLEIEFKFAEEQASIMTGILVFKNGVLVEEKLYDDYSKEAFELYFELWGGEELYSWNEKEQTYVYCDD